MMDEEFQISPDFGRLRVREPVCATCKICFDSNTYTCTFIDGPDFTQEYNFTQFLLGKRLNLFLFVVRRGYLTDKEKKRF